MPSVFPPLSALLEQIPLSIIQTLARKNKVSVYLVGGAMRDCLLNRPCCDFDFAVSKNALKVARQLADQIRGSYVLLDKEHGCARVVKKNVGDAHCASPTYIYDFADFRDKTLKGDLFHRDFTINTLCVDIDKLSPSLTLPVRQAGRLTMGEGIPKFSSPPLVGGDRGGGFVLIDLYGGVKDIQTKKIKMVSARGFKDDPLRVVRAFSHRSLLGFSIDKKTLAQIKKDLHLLRDISYERIREELFKILSSERAAENFKAMDRIGLLEQIIPQVSVMFKVTQGTYHHLDVWPHSLETIAQLEGVFKEVKDDTDIQKYLNEDLGGGHRRFAVMKLAALLHDIGKPDTKKIADGKTSFHSHERVGKIIVRKIGKMLKISTKERYALEDMVYWHLRPGYLSNFKNPSRRSIFRYFRDTQDEALSVLLLSLADQRSTRGPMTTEEDQRHHENIVKSLVKQYIEEQKKEPFVRLIDGNDLIRRLKLKPSPLFGKILHEVEEKQVLGKIKTKAEALELARAIVVKGLKD